MLIFVEKFIDSLYGIGCIATSSDIWAMIRPYIQRRWLTEELYEDFFRPSEVAADYLNADDAMEYLEYLPIVISSNM